MTTRRLSLLAAAVPLFALCAMFVFNDSVSSAPRDKTPPTPPSNLAGTYEIYVNGVLSPLPVSAGVSTDFVYATAFGDNEFFIEAVDLSGNSSAPSKTLKLFLWPC